MPRPPSAFPEFVVEGTADSSLKLLQKLGRFLSSLYNHVNVIAAYMRRMQDPSSKDACVLNRP